MSATSELPPFVIRPSERTPSTPATMDWTIEDAKLLYNIEGWGIGYFDINDKGHVTVHPTKEPERGLDLFELATDGPGFAVDEPLETLGERLALPPFLEPQREQIEAGLKPI